MSSSVSDQWSKSLKKITAINRFAQSDAAGIKPGEDAHDLIDRTRYRRQNLGATPTRNQHAFPIAQGGLSGSLRGLDPAVPLRHGSTSSESTCSERNSVNSSSTRSASSQRRVEAHRISPYRKHVSSRPSHHHPPSSLSDASETEPPFYSKFSKWWAESPFITPVSEFGSATITAASTTPSLTSGATASTCDSLPEAVILDSASEKQPAHSGGCWPPQSSYTNVNTSTNGSTMSLPPTPAYTFHEPTNPFYTTVINRSETSLRSLNPKMSTSMPRQGSSQESVVHTNNADQTTSKHDDGSQKDDARNRSESDASKPSNDEPSTPRKSSDDPPSDHEDSGSSSDGFTDIIQQDALEKILSPIKHVVVERLVCHILNSPELVGTEVFIRQAQDRKLSLPASPIPFEHLKLSPQVDTNSVDDAETKGDNMDCIFDHNNDLQDGNNDSGPASQHRKAAGTIHSNPKAAVTKSLTSPHSGQKRKEAPGGDSGDDDDDDDSEDDGRRRPALKAPRAGPNRRIACPYFQRDPAKVPRADSCFRNGFQNIHKMKEHLHRVHSHSIQCPRCFQVFNREDQLNEHLRALGSDLCQPSENPPVVDAYNQTQARALQDRMRGRSDIQKWKAIWNILFPHDPEEAIPEPWWTSQNPLRRPEVSNFISRYEAYTREHIAEVVRPLVEALVYPLFDDLMGANLELILRDSLEQIFTAFRDGPGRGLLDPTGPGFRQPAPDVDANPNPPQPQSLDAPVPYPQPGPYQPRYPQPLYQINTTIPPADVEMNTTELVAPVPQQQAVTAAHGLPTAAPAASYTVNGMEQPRLQPQSQPQLSIPAPANSYAVGSGQPGYAQLLSANAHYGGGGGGGGGGSQSPAARTPDSWDFAYDALNESTYPGAGQGMGGSWGQQ